MPKGVDDRLRGCASRSDCLDRRVPFCFGPMCAACCSFQNSTPRSLGTPPEYIPPTSSPMGIDRALVIVQPTGPQAAGVSV